MTFSVYLLDRHIGTLAADRGRLSFTYGDEAIDAPETATLSVRMPIRREPYGDEASRAFFENLLPEDEYRRLITTALRLSDTNTVGLLGAIGGECAGAVSIWPRDTERPIDHTYRSLSNNKLRELFAVPGEPELANAQREGRLSLAGAQAKLTVRRQDGDWSLPINGAPATHILKRTRVSAPYLVENECFCMWLAAAAGLPVPQVEYIDVGIPLLAVRRFDRAQDDSKIRRIHQEDLCQATGTLPANKYEAEGGPGLAVCADVVRQHSALPIADLPLLVRWTAFNYVVGNEDAHGKNLALLHTDEGIRLAPFYDLVSSIVYQGLSRKAAMAIGGERRYHYVEQRHWQRYAKALALRDGVVRRLLLETAESIEENIGGTEHHARDRFGPVDLVAMIVNGVRTRLEKLRSELASP
jgi:serine/threonine-protein kinase HipA